MELSHEVIGARLHFLYHRKFLSYDIKIRSAIEAHSCEMKCCINATAVYCRYDVKNEIKYTHKRCRCE